MPNHTANLLTVRGAEDQITEMIQFVREMEKDNKGQEVKARFSFNKIIPKPPSLNIEVGTRTENGLKILSHREGNSAELRLLHECAKEWECKNENVADMTLDDFADFLIRVGRASIEMAQTSLSNIQLYGHKDWHDWCIANWGTKWDAFEIRDWQQSTGQAEIYFETAWSPPTPVLEALSSQFPKLTFQLSYADEGGAFLATSIFQDGDEEITEYEWESKDGVALLKKLGRYYEPSTSEDED